MNFSLFSFSTKSAKESAAPMLRTGSDFQTAVVTPETAKIIRENCAFNSKQIRAYDAAVTTNLNLDFTPTIGSANAEILTSLYITRGRCRTLVKDYSFAKGALRNEVNNTVGHDPFRLESKVGIRSKNGTIELEVETNEKIQDFWREFGNRKYFTVRRDMPRDEFFQCAAASVWRDGSLLIRIHRAFKNKFSVAFELIDADRLQESYMGRADETGNVIRFSIERDEFGAPVAYWILTRHPGDVFSSGFSSKVFRERVPVENIIHVNNIRLRPEQDIGFPECDSVIQELHRARQFDIAHVTAAIKNCVSGFFIKQEFPTGMQMPGDPGMDYGHQAGGGNQKGDGKGGRADRVEVLEAGQARITELGQTPMVLSTKFPNEAAVGFRKDTLHSVASGLGQSYAAVSGDFEGYSFSTARAGEVPQRDNYIVRQDNLIHGMVECVFEVGVECAILSGQLDLPISRLGEFVKAAHFHGKRWPYVNPLQDAQTDIMLIEAGLQSPQETLAQSENHRNVETVYSEIAAAKEKATTLGLDFSQEVTKPTVEKGAPGQTLPDPLDGGAQPPPKKQGQRSLLSDATWRRTQSILRINGEH